jgi:ABC-type amino acid transport/signal transduction systems, periplasmic component/domain
MMNFKPKVYEAEFADMEKWGRKQLNGSYTGLIGEIKSGKADMALGNLYYTPYYLELMDLTIPYTTECLTFLTPEALTNNSWMTLILPFR